MLDIKAFKTALEQLETERKIPKEKIIEAIEQALAAAYKKDYDKKGQIVRTHFNMETGETEFYQVKIVVEESTVYMPKDAESEEEENEVFNKLSQGGKIEMPLGKMFWGAYFGMFTDKFGIQWMINCDSK